MKYTILTNKKNKINIEFSKKLKVILKKHTYVKKGFDYAFIIGGDGTFLSFAQNLLDKPVKVVFINSGKLGFYSYINDPKKLLEEEVFSDKYYINIDVLNVQYKKKIYQCINDFSLYSNYTAHIKTFINDVNLQSFHGNGVLVATPFGSTARNKSLKGAIMLPNTELLSIMEIEPINNRFYSSLNSPIIFKNNNKIKVESTCFKKWWMLLDGRQLEFSDEKAMIDIWHTKSKCQILIKINDSDWIRKLNYAFITK